MGETRIIHFNLLSPSLSFSSTFRGAIVLLLQHQKGPPGSVRSPL